MKCKSCRRELPENALFCCWCGEKQIKEKKRKDEVKVPKATKHGRMWRIQLRAENTIITEYTEEACILKAKAFRAGYLSEHKNGPKQLVKNVINTFIDDHTNTLSPSTVKEYRSCYRNHFADIADQDILAVPWQKRMNDLCNKLSSKTVDNIWKLALAAMHYAKIEPPDVKLPQIVMRDMPFLDYQQIQIFLDAIRGKPVELAALLALHSLRRSEILALTADSIDRNIGMIHVRGAKVVGENGLTFKEANKTKSSARNIPVMIPRLLEIIPENAEGFLVTGHENTIIKRINSVCRETGLPEVGVHGLRRSFASLAYHLGWDERTVMLVGGWSNIQTAHKYYIKLAGEDIVRQTDSMKEFYVGKEGKQCSTTSEER